MRSNCDVTNKVYQTNYHNMPLNYPPHENVLLTPLEGTNLYFLRFYDVTISMTEQITDYIFRGTCGPSAPK